MQVRYGVVNYLFLSVVNIANESYPRFKHGDDFPGSKPLLPFLIHRGVHHSQAVLI